MDGEYLVDATGAPIKTIESTLAIADCDVLASLAEVGWWFAFSGSLGATRARTTWDNPSGSGYRAIFTWLSFNHLAASEGGSLSGSLLANPTTGLPTATATCKNRVWTVANANNSPSPLLVKHDTSATAMSGGTEIPIASVAVADRRTYPKTIAVLEPGALLGLHVRCLNTTSSAAFAVGWRLEAI